jgi:hypothetical protein
LSLPYRLCSICRVTEALPEPSKPGLSPWTVAALVVPIVAFVPFLPGVATGGCFYLRDISSYFVPLRNYVVAGLRAGEVRHWNPYVNEGVPVLLPPLGYPLDALQALVPGPFGLSLLLALHVPLAALCFLGLARHLGHPPGAASLGALIYALSGFSLSCVSLYIHAEAFAWAPLVVWMLLRAGSGGARDVALGAAAVALCVSTSGIEIAGQAVACALVLAASRRAARCLRVAAATVLGAGIAASPLLLLAQSTTGGRRAAGFGVAGSLASSVHPVSLLQTVVAGIFGDPVAAGTRYWGTPYWDGYPYILSLYLGAAALCVVAVGAARRAPLRTRLVLLLLAGLAVALGRWSRLDLILGLAPALTRFRYPVKAFFTVVLASSLLASAGAALLASEARAWRKLVLIAGLAGLLLASVPFVAGALPASSAWLQGHFFTASLPQPLRAGALAAIAADAAQGAVPALAVALLSLLTVKGRLRPRGALLAIAAVIAADLLRAGAGLNPTAPASLYGLSPEMAIVAARLRRDGGRVFTCAPQAMPAFREQARTLGPRVGLWATLVWRESLSPYANMDAAVPATGFDATALVSARSSFSERETSCNEPDTLLRLRESGVRFVLSIQALEHEDLQLVDVASPARTAPLRVFVYRLSDALEDPVVWSTPDDVGAEARGHTLSGAIARYVAEEAEMVRLAVSSPAAGYVIVRNSDAPGWSATVDGRPTPVVAANGRHQAVAVPAGASEVVLRYRAPRFGALVGVASAACAACLAWPRRRRRNAESP